MESGGSVSRPEMVSEDLLSGIGAGSNAVDLLDAHLDEVLGRSGLHPGVGDGDGLLVVGTGGVDLHLPLDLPLSWLCSLP